MAERSGARGLPTGVWALGFVSLFMDASSELIHSLLPALFVSLGVGAVAIGLIEGVAEATAMITKMFSGALSDWLGKRKILAVIGYGLAAVTKPLFPLAQSAEIIFLARFIDRIGKGIRGAPRDALIADITPPAKRGAAYGLRQSMDAAGAFIGPLLAIALMAILANNLSLVLWFATIPAVLCMASLVFGVDEPHRELAAMRADSARTAFGWAGLTALGSGYWLIVAVGACFALARFSMAFLTLRAIDLGMPIGLSPVVMVVMMAVFSLSSYPVGELSDRMNRRTLLALGFVALIGADLVLAGATGYWLALAGVAVWGLHLGLTQGLLAVFVADAAPAHLRGSAFGLFNLVNGVALLGASVMAGGLWQAYGAVGAFLASAGFAGLALFVLLLSFRLKSWLR